MTTQRHFRQIVLSWLATVLAAAPSAPVQAQDANRADFVDAFYALRDQTREAYKNRFRKVVVLGKGGKSTELDVLNEDEPKISKFPGVNIRNTLTDGKVKLTVKVWAKPVVNGLQANNAVSLEKYKWKPGEKFFLFFETSGPVTVRVFQDYPNKPSERRLPDPDVPETYKPIHPTGAYQYPPRLSVDDTQDDELMSIIVEAVNPTNLPQLPGNKITGGKFGVLAKEFNAKSRITPSQVAAMAKFRIDGMENTAGNPDEVASFYYTTEQIGSFQLRLRKR